MHLSLENIDIILYVRLSLHYYYARANTSRRYM